MVGIFFYALGLPFARVCRPSSFLDGLTSTTSVGLSASSPHFTSLRFFVRSQCLFPPQKRPQAEKVARYQLPQATAVKVYTLSPYTDTMTCLIISIAFHSGLSAAIPKPGASDAIPTAEDWSPCRQRS